MNFKTILREAFTALTRNWIRSVLTILGIAVGVGSFICVIAIGNAGTSSIEDQLQSLGDNFIWIEAGSRTRGGMRMGARGTRSLVLGDARAIMEQVPLLRFHLDSGHAKLERGQDRWDEYLGRLGHKLLHVHRRRGA
jgi:hypothetical protein